MLDLSQRTTKINNLVIGFDGDDKINGGSGRDWLYGSVGIDTISGGSGDDLIHGGDRKTAIASDGTDTADYTKGDLGQATAHGITVQIGGGGTQLDGLKPILVTDDGYGNQDRLFSIEKIVGSKFADTFKITSFLPSGTQLTLDGNGAQSTPNGHDVLDASALGSGISLNIGSNGSGTLGPGNGAGATIDLKNFNTEIRATAFDDSITDLSGGPQKIYAGAGNDVVTSNGINSRIYLDAGDDTLMHAGAGTIVEGGAGKDTVFFSDGILFADAEAGDRLTQTGDRIVYCGQTLLTGGTRWIYSESPYAIGQGGLFKYGKNQAGELVIRDFRGDEMFVSNYVGGPGAPYNTAGVYLVEYDLKAVRFSDDWPDGYTILNTWRFFYGEGQLRRVALERRGPARARPRRRRAGADRRHRRLAPVRHRPRRLPRADRLGAPRRRPAGARPERQRQEMSLGRNSSSVKLWMPASDR